MNFSTRVSRWVGLAVLAILLVGYAILALINAEADGFLVNDQGSKFLQVQLLVGSRWRELAIAYPGRVFDPTGDFSPLGQAVFFRRGGEFVSIYLTPYLLLVSVLYAICGPPGLYVVSVVTGAALAWSVVKLGRPTITSNQVPLLMITVGIASPILFYATEFWEHAAAVFLSIAGLNLFLSDYRPNWFWSGVCWGVGAACRIEVLLFGLAAGAATAMLRIDNWTKRSIRVLLAAFSILLPIGAFYRNLTGTWLGPQFLVNYAPRSHSLSTWFQAWLATWHLRMSMIIPDNKPVLLALALGLLFILAARFLLRRVPAIIWGVTCAWVTVVSVLALLAVAGGMYPNDVVTCFPMMTLIAITGSAPRDADSDPLSHLRLWGLIVILYVTLMLLIAPNGGGRQWGPRYLLPIFPLLALLSMRAFDRIMGSGSTVLRSLGLATFSVAMAVSVGIQVIGLLVSVGRVGNTAIVQTVRNTPEKVIITEGEGYHISMVAATTFYEKLWFMVGDLSNLGKLLENLEVHGETSVVFIASADHEDRISSLLLAEGCHLSNSTPISLARPPLQMIHATCGGTAQGP